MHDNDQSLFKGHFAGAVFLILGHILVDLDKRQLELFLTFGGLVSQELGLHLTVQDDVDFEGLGLEDESESLFLDGFLGGMGIGLYDGQVLLGRNGLA